MSQIVRKKKGRPSKADLAARAAAAAESNNGHSNHNRRPTEEEEEEEEEERDIRRSLRRRSGVRYNLLDYDEEDYLDDDDEFEFEEDRMEADDDGGRREKKLKFVLKLRNSSDSGRAARSNGGCSGDSAVRSRRSAYRGSESEEEEDDEEERFVKKRKISDEEDEIDDDFANNDDEEERDGKRDYHKPDFVYGGMNDPLSPTPMPEKKQLELILDKLQKKDIYGVYADPVDPDELPDYHDIIKNPMDFSTVRKKLANGSYSVFEQFESDIYLICSNAMKYNTPDTVYHKQARTIKELAQRKFHRVRSYIKRTRIENEGNKKETSSEPKAKPTPIVKKQMRNSVGHSAAHDRTQDPVSSDFSYGATLATTDPHNTSNGVQNITFERHSNCEGLAEDMSSLHVESSEKVEDVQSGRGMTKFGRKASVGDENHRATYEISNQPVDRSESIFATFEGEDKQLIPVGLYEQHSYAQSLAHYAANLGSVAWRTASKRIEQALPQGSKFGRGWVMEYEPTPTPLLYQSPKEYASAKKPQFPAAAASAKHQKPPSEAKTSSTKVLGTGGISLNVEPAFSPSSSVQQLHNPFVRKLQNASSNHLSENPWSPADDRGQKRPISDSKPPQMRSITPTGTPTQQHNPFSTRLKSGGIPAKTNKSSDCAVTTNGYTENGSSFGGSQPATPTGPVMLPHNLFSRTMRPPAMDANTSTLITNQKTVTNPFMQRQLPGSADGATRNSNFLQAVAVRPQLQASGNVNRGVDINQMATTSPSSVPKMSFPQRQEQQQGLSDPLQAMRVSVENAQKQHNQMHNLLGPLQVRPSMNPQRGDNNNNNVAAAWMHASPADMNRASQIPAGSLHNKTQELYHPHILQSSECPVPGLRYFPAAAHEYSHGKASNEAHGRNRPTVFPQLLGADVSRMQQLQSPRHNGLGPRAEQKSEHKRKRDTLPPDLNVAFQSTVDPQQPDLALQL